MAKKGRPTKYTKAGIYALCLKGEVKYIGQSKNIQKRYRQHCSLAQNVGKTKRNEWLYSILENGIIPELILLEETNDLDSREIYWINKYKDQNLVNTARGGKLMWHCRKSKESKPWGTKMSPVQKRLCTIKQNINLMKRLGKKESAENMETKLNILLKKIESFGKDKMNMVIWERHYG